jgi:DNA topoisomerase IB
MMYKGVPGRSHLVPAKKTIHGKTKTFLAVRYINPTEVKRRIQEFLGTRKKESALTRHLRKNPPGIRAYLPTDLIAIIQPTKTGQRYYTGNPKAENARKVSVNVDLIDRVFEFETPIGGMVALVVRKDNKKVQQYLNEKREKSSKAKTARCKHLGKNIEGYRSNCEKLIKSGKKEKVELGIVLSLIDRYQMRIGGSEGGIEEAKIKNADLKPGMVVTHESWGEKAIPQKVVWDKGRTKLMFRNMKTKEDHPIPTKLTDFIRLGHYGTTTLESRHVKVDKGKVFIDTIGKSGVWQQFEITEQVLAAAIKELLVNKKPKDRVFPSVKRKKVTDVLDKYKAHPHDFRTYHATKVFMEEQSNFPVPTTKKELRQIEKSIMEKISQKLWNQPGTVRSSYIPAPILVAWRTGLLKKIEEGKKKGKIEKSLFIIMDDVVPNGSRVYINSIDEEFNDLL